MQSFTISGFNVYVGWGQWKIVETPAGVETFARNSSSESWGNPILVETDITFAESKKSLQELTFSSEQEAEKFLSQFSHPI